MAPTTDFVEQQEEEKARLAREATETRCNWIAVGIGFLIVIAIILLVF